MIVGQGQLLDQRSRRGEFDEPLDPLVADRVRAREPGEGHDAEHLAGNGRGGADAFQVVGETGGRQLLSGVADRLVGVRMDLDDDPVGSGGGGGERHRLHQVTAAGGVAGVDEHRQMGPSLEHGDRHQVQGEAVRGLERADPALAEDHRLVALLEDVLGRHQQLVERRRQPALEQHRPPAASDLGQERVVLHVARADLQHVGDVEQDVEIPGVHHLGDDRQSRLRLGLGEQPQPLLAEALERVRRRARLVGAAAEHRGARVADGLRGLQHLLARLDRARPGDQREMRSADRSARDLKYRLFVVLLCCNHRRLVLSHARRL